MPEPVWLFIYLWKERVAGSYLCLGWRCHRSYRLNGFLFHQGCLLSELLITDVGGMAGLLALDGRIQSWSKLGGKRGLLNILFSQERDWSWMSK